MINNKSFFGVGMMFFVSIIGAFGQSDSLQVRYDELLNRSETYTQFKVIRTDRLDGLWDEVQDSIRSYQARQLATSRKVNDLASKVQTAEAEADKLASQLEETTDKLGKINFLGIEFNTIAYHSVVWAIILGLLTLTLITYGMYHRSNVVSQTTVQDLHTLNAEFEQFKERARTRETKVKRELQTAVNALDELKRGSKK